MTDEISQRLTAIRKHLSDRLEEKLTVDHVAARCSLTPQQVYRLEHGLNGTTSSLVALVNYYHSQGYNYEWIFTEDNNRIPMVTPSSRQLQLITENIQKLGQQLTMGYAQLSAQLEEIGLEPLGMGVVDNMLVDIPSAEGFAL